MRLCADTGGNTAQNLFRKLEETSEKYVFCVHFIFFAVQSTANTIDGQQKSPQIASRRFIYYRKPYTNPIENTWIYGFFENHAFTKSLKRRLLHVVATFGDRGWVFYDHRKEF